MIYEVYTRHSLRTPKAASLSSLINYLEEVTLGSQTEAWNAPKRKSMYLGTQKSHLPRYFRKLRLRLFSPHFQGGDPCRILNQVESSHHRGDGKATICGGGGLEPPLENLERNTGGDVRRWGKRKRDDDCLRNCERKCLSWNGTPMAYSAGTATAVAHG